MKNRISIVSVITVFLISYTMQRSILKSDDEFNETDNKQQTFSFKYETKDGTKRKEDLLIYPNANGKGTINIVTGSFSYTGPDGRTYGAVYKADENGYRAKVQIPFGNATETTTTKRPEVFTTTFRPESIDTAALGSLAGGGIG